MKRTVLFLAVGLWLATPPIWGAEPSPAGPLTLRQAAELALAANPGLQAAESARQAAVERRRQARSFLLPRLDLKETFTHGNNPVYAFGTRLGQRSFTAADFDLQALNRPDGVNNFRTELTLYQSVWEGGRVRAQARAADRQLDAQTEAVRLARQQLLAEVIGRYQAVQLGREHLDTARSALRSAESVHDRVRALYEAGQVVRSDLLRLEVHLAEVRRTVIETSNQVRLGLAALDTTLGGQAGPGLELVTPLETHAGGGAAEADLIDLALGRRPDRAMLLAGLAAGEATVQAARAEYRPGVGVFSTLEYNRGTRQGAAGGNYLVGVQLHWNLFDGFQKGARVAEARATVQEAGHRLRELDLTIALQVREALYRLQSAQARLEVGQAAVELADEGLRITRERYEAGLATLTDLLSAETARVDARTGLTAARHEINQAVAHLELATGTLDLDSRLFAEPVGSPTGGSR